MNRTLLRASLLLALAFPSLATASNQPIAPSISSGAGALLYGAQGGNFTTSNLYLVDPATAATTVVGPLGQALTGLAVNPVTGVLYGVTNGSSACARCLVTVDRTTGAATVVGPLTLIIADIAFRADGSLFGWSETSDDLATINLTTGTATAVSNSGLSTYGDAMDFTASGTLYVFPRGDNGSYYTVDTATGLPTLAGTVTSTPTPGCNGGASLSAGTMYIATSTMYVSRIDNCATQPYPADLLTINIGTGVATVIGSLPSQFDALAFVPVADVSITKSGPASAVAGSNISYNVTVTNLGPSSASNVTMTDVVPANTTFVSLAQSGTPYTCTTPAAGGTGTVSCTAPVIANAATTTFTIVVKSNVAATGTVTNTATVSTSPADSSPTNNTATATTTLQPSTAIPALDPRALAALSVVLAVVALHFLKK